MSEGDLLRIRDEETTRAASISVHLTLIGPACSPRMSPMTKWQMLVTSSNLSALQQSQRIALIPLLDRKRLVSLSISTLR